MPPDRPGSAMRATDSVLARAALCPSQPRGSCAAAWPCPRHSGPAFCGADALGTATPTWACLPVSPGLGCPRQLRGLRSPPRARHAPGPRGGWLPGRAECTCERPLCECDGRSTPPGPSRSLRPEQGHSGCSGVRGGRRNSERPRLPRQRCLRAHSQPKSRAVRAAPTLARGLAEWVLSEPRPGSREGASHGTSRGGVREHKGPRAGWFLLNAILAKCYNLAQDLADTAVNRVSLTGTQPDKCSQLQRRN